MHQFNPDNLPATPWLLLKAAFKKAQRGEQPQLSQARYICKQLLAQENKFQAYDRLTGWHQTKWLHPLYPQLMAFPLQLSLLLRDDFPFAITGLVHIANTVQQFQPLASDAPMDIECYLDELQPHRRGWQFSVVTEAKVDNELVWRASAVNLSRAKMPGQSKSSAPEEDEHPWSHQQSLSFGSNIGRQYARISGDFNPIHLTALTAKLFGFKRHIAHGMFTKAKCLSVLARKQLWQPMQGADIQCQFIQPLYLPAKATLLAGNENGCQFRLQSAEGRPHLLASIESL